MSDYMPDSSVQQRFCRNCEEQVRAGAAFCVSCGMALSTPQQRADHASQSPSNATGSESLDVAQNRDEVTEAVLAFVFAESWKESERIAEERRHVLLTDAADEELAALITSNKGAEDTVAALEEHRALLARYRQKGIDTASDGGVAAENTQERREQTTVSGVDFDYRDPVQSFINTTRSIVLDPVDFFSSMVRQGDYINPLVFALICAEVWAVLQGILIFLGALAGFGEVGGAFGSLILYIALTPIIFPIGLFVRAGILHLLTVLIIKPETTGFETTFRASSYSLMPLLLTWIPILGPIISGIWSTVLAVLGIRDGHSTTTGKAAAVVLIPVGVMALISIVLTIIVWVIFSVVFNSMGGY